MALRLRRGTNSERLAITPAEGELVYTTDTKKIHAGDGTTVGGNIVSGINNLLEDATPQLGGTLDTNSQNIQGVGNIDITGNITASGTVTATNFIGDYKGSIVGDDSTVLVDAVNSKITGVVDTSSITATSGTVNGTLIATALQGPLTGNVTGDASGNHSGTFSGAITATGTLDGDLTGSVFADDSSVMIDAISKNISVTDINSNNITANNVTATSFVGDVTGSVFSDGSNVIIDGLTGALTGPIRSVATSAGDTGAFTYTVYNSGTTAHSLIIQKARGTEASPSALVAGDDAGGIMFADASKNLSVGQIVGMADPEGTITGSAVPGKISIRVANSVGAPIERAYVESSGATHTLGIHWGHSTSPTGIGFYSINNNNTGGTDGPRLLMRRSRGTYETPLAVADTDVLHRITFGGHDGTSYGDNAFITCRVDGTVSTGIIPTAIDIKTTSAAGNLQTVGTFGNGAFKLPVYADNTARDAAVPAPEAGMIIFNTTGTKFQGYTGAAWADLN